ncbi:MAG: LapA family protein [Deltaproteobacteria bacterium]|nr:LapA family protein [Deltaproteobacteria bacterium]
MKHFRLTIFVLFIVFMVTLLVQNHTAFSTKVVFKFDLSPLPISYYTSEMMLYFIIPVTFILGACITLLFWIIDSFQLKREIKHLIRESQEKDQELNSLRNLPLTSDNVAGEHVALNQLDNIDL